MERLFLYLNYFYLYGLFIYFICVNLKTFTKIICKFTIIQIFLLVFSADFGVNYFKQFTLVMNALDNRAARNHVNRMCLASEVPLIESGTAGYEGQVELIKKGMEIILVDPPSVFFFFN